MPKIVKKKKLKILPFLLLILVVAGIVFGVDIYLDTPIENLIVKGNVILSDQEILELAGLHHYPSFYKSSASKIEKKVKSNPFIKQVQVHKKFYHVVVLEIKEYRVLFKKEEDGKIVLENQKELAVEHQIPYALPRLVNYVPNTKYQALIDGMRKMEKQIREKISEISYVPNEYDKDRFLLYMDDGNSVYLTLTKFEMINYYNEVLPQLEGKKGILYLDSGNHFQIME